MTDTMDAQEAKQQEFELHHTKNRIVAVDITRCLAAIIVMLGHVASFSSSNAVHVMLVWKNLTFGPVSVIFFLFAGYFACRNITWKKALYNSLWCLFPFILWNIIAWFMEYMMGLNVSTQIGWQQFLGLGQFRISSFWLGDNPCVPVNGPLWFMRDLVFLFLLAPILYKFAKWIFPVLLFLAVFSETANSFTHMNDRVLSLYSLIFFSLGCFLRTFSRENQKKMLSNCSSTWLILYYVLTLGCAIDACCHVTGLHIWDRNWYFAPSALSLIMLYWTARWMEINIKFITPLALKLAPVTFLTFASHWPLFHVLKVCFPSLMESVFALLLPFAEFALMYFFFVLLKRRIPLLLHLVAHYKLRPDDLRR